MAASRQTRGDPPTTGIEWVVDAFGCSPEALRSPESLSVLFERIVAEQGLNPLSPATVHVFPPPGGVTAVLLLSESHLTCHTCPEYGYAALNLYSCRPRPPVDFPARLAEALGAAHVEVRSFARGGVTATDAVP